VTRGVVDYLHVDVGATAEDIEAGSTWRSDDLSTNRTVTPLSALTYNF